MKISKTTAAALMRETKGSIFTCTFEKKDGSIRQMNCRTDVKAHLRGGKLKYDPRAANNLIVFDMQKGEYRTINLDTVRHLAISGTTYEVEN